LRDGRFAAGLQSSPLRRPPIKYCNNDCIILFNIIAKFNSLIFDKFNLNIHRFPTLSSLALGIYRANYMKDFKIPRL
jgi:hypothetical protein